MIHMRNWDTLIFELQINTCIYTPEYQFLKYLSEDEQIRSEKKWLSQHDYDTIIAAHANGANAHTLVCDYFPVGSREILDEAMKNAIEHGPRIKPLDTPMKDIVVWEKHAEKSSLEYVARQRETDALDTTPIKATAIDKELGE